MRSGQRATTPTLSLAKQKAHVPFHISHLSTLPTHVAYVPAYLQPANLPACLLACLPVGLHTCLPTYPTYTCLHTHTHTHSHTHTHHHVAMVCSAWPSYAHCMIAIHTKGPRVSCVVAPETICTSIRSWADALRRIPQASELECNGKSNNAISECNDKNNHEKNSAIDSENMWTSRIAMKTNLKVIPNNANLGSLLKSMQEH